MVSCAVYQGCISEQSYCLDVESEELPQMRTHLIKDLKCMREQAMWISGQEGLHRGNSMCKGLEVYKRKQRGQYGWDGMSGGKVSGEDTREVEVGNSPCRTVCGR